MYYLGYTKKFFVVFVHLLFKFNCSLFYLAMLCLVYSLLHNLSDQLMDLQENFPLDLLRKRPKARGRKKTGVA